jgi:hypothetical protein
MFREKLVKTRRIHILVRLGLNSFVSGIRACPILMITSNDYTNSQTTSLDISNRNLSEKPSALVHSDVTCIYQTEWEKQIDGRFIIDTKTVKDKNEIEIVEFCDARNGMSAGDGARFESLFWEIQDFGLIWEYLQSSATNTKFFLGREKIIRWEKECGEMGRLAESVKHLNHAAQNWRRGKPLWGQWGVVVNQIGAISTIYTGEKFDGSCFAIVPEKREDVIALIAYSQGGSLKTDLKKINPTWSLKSPKTLLQLKMNIEDWCNIGKEVFPLGLPAPFSNDPTQWIFHGSPCGSVFWDDNLKWTAVGDARIDDSVLQISVARLLGYRWPAELDPDMELADEQRALVASCESLLDFADKDGIVCIPAVRGERGAADRLLDLLVAAYGSAWKSDTLGSLLAASDHAGKTLESWLRDKFFSQHCKLFQHRPFVWHIWDGLKDGFSALVNYHTFDYKKLETLIYTYLGDWISRQKLDLANNVDGAQEKLDAAERLKKKLELILQGEAPYDIFVRWKPLAEQSIGWNPDLNDGVRLNIRPLITAEVLRFNKKPQINIAWDKDRGKDVESAPWYKTFGGERINDHHLTREEKMKAREGK